MFKFVVGLLVGLAVGTGVTLGIVVLARATGPQQAKAGEAQPQASTAKPQAMPALTQEERRRADDNRRLNSISSTLQTLRGQIELFKIQHADVPPAPGALVTVLTNRTNTTDVARSHVSGMFGPYVQQVPTNPVNGWGGVTTVANPGYGWVYNADGGQYTVQAVNANGDGVLTY